MELMAQADVVLALGTRLNPFSTLPAYNIALPQLALGLLAEMLDRR